MKHIAIDHNILINAAAAAIAGKGPDRAYVGPIACPACEMVGIRYHLTLIQNRIVELEEPRVPSGQLIPYNIKAKETQLGQDGSYVWELEQLHECKCCLSQYYLLMPLTITMYNRLKEVARLAAVRDAGFEDCVSLRLEDL